MTDSRHNIPAVNAAGVKATFVNEKYGKHKRNVFDIWLAKSDSPTPLVIYIHGGGFVSGDKSRYYDMSTWIPLLENGISVATINYRFLNEPPFGILASMNDSKRCLQYIKHNANKYNIDKNKIACSGGSAGAGTSLWLAFSEDMADTNNEDPVLRESTQVCCAGAFSTQATYDILRWDEIFDFPISQMPEAKIFILQAFGLDAAKNPDPAKQTAIRKNLDFLKKMDKNVPPFFVKNHYDKEITQDPDTVLHHPLHAKALQKRAKEVGAKAIVYAPAIGIEDESGKDIVSFFLENLK